MILRLLGLVVALAAASGDARAGCGPDAAACTIALGSYHAVLPQSAPRGTEQGAVVFLHGYGGSGADTLKNTGMVTALAARGYAVIAPDGLFPEGRDRRSWNFRGDAGAARDDDAFLRAVADDAAVRFGLPRDRMVLAGFSVGGSMVSYAACRHPDDFAAFAPVAGSFWRPHPEACAGPVRLLHVHGWADGTVPLEGRQLRSGIAQGDVFAALAIWRHTNGCTREDPDMTQAEGSLWRRAWTLCTPGSRLEFVLHPGGHMIPPGWADMMLDWYDAATARAP